MQAFRAGNVRSYVCDVPESAGDSVPYNPQDIYVVHAAVPSAHIF